MPTSPAPTALQRNLYRMMGLLCFNRITVHDRPVLPRGEGVLFLGLHRNGALDGVPYLQAVPDATFLVSAQLHRSAVGRFLFPGIAVSRSKDRERGIVADNNEGVTRCVEHLDAGGELFILPEGTSSLGPRHLPFKSGAARIAQAVLAHDRPLNVVPIAVHYECAWKWQSRIEVAFGRPLRLLPETPPSIDELQQQFSAALEAIGINTESTKELRFIEMLAYGATLGTDLSYTQCLKRFENNVPADLRRDAELLTQAATGMRVMKHQGVPLVPIGSALPYLVAWILLCPIIAAFMLINLPPIAAGHLASRLLPDELNVVAFWRALVGVPVTLLWTVSMIAALWLTGGPLAALGYIAVSALGLRLFYRFRKLSVAVFNSVFAAKIRQPLLAFRATLLKEVQGD